MTIDLKELDERNRESWRRAASGWEKWQESMREGTEPVTSWLLHAIDPQPGQRVLELAAGPGETGFAAAQRIGPDGSLICTDQSDEMVAVARRRAAELGLENVEFMVLDAQKLGLESDCVDAVVCRWGYMLMAEPHAALRHTWRVLRPGGRLALATWDTPDRNLWMATPAIQLVARGLMPPPDPTAPGPFSMPDLEALAQRLVDAGFDDARGEKLEFEFRYPDFDTYWEMTFDLAAPIAQVLASSDASAVSEVRDAVRAALAQFEGADGEIAVPASAVVATATA